MLIYDKYQKEYYEVIPVKKIEEKIEELESHHKVYYEAREYEISARIDFAKRVLQQLIKENCEEEE